MVEATAAVFFHTKLKNKDQDWNIHGHYCATKSKNTEGKFGNLNNINMSVAHKKNQFFLQISQNSSQTVIKTLSLLLKNEQEKYSTNMLT
jgi:hypothetical protein